MIAQWGRELLRTALQLPAALGLASALVASTTLAQSTATPEPEAAVGMVDQPCPPDAFGRSPAEQAYARAVVAEGPLDPTVLVAMAKGAAERTRADARRQANDWADLCRYRLEDESDARAGGVRAVFIGNSITELWRAADPAFFDHGVVNRGLSGQTSGQTLLRFQQDVVALHPRAVHILVGTNDVAGNNGPNRPEDLENNIRAMTAIARANGIRVILGSITPAGVIPWRAAIHPTTRIRELNVWMAAFAKAQGAIYVDYYTALAGPDGAMKPGISRDGVHPKVSGYRLMEPLARAALVQAHVP